MNQGSRNLLLWVFLAVLLLVFWNVFEKQEQNVEQKTYSQFLEAVQGGQVESVLVKENEITGTYKQGAPGGKSGKFSTHALTKDEDLIPLLKKAGVSIEAKEKDEESWLLVIFVQLLPILLLIVVWLFFMRQIQVGGGKALSFGKSRARLVDEGPSKVTFNDVAGIEESKKELEAIVQFLKDPKKFTKLGGRIPKGVLLVGSPGTGKTLLSRAIAGEAGVPFFSISGSDFVEMFVGVGASRVRDLFLRGKKNAPCIIFIDEIDAVGRHRGAGLGGGHDEREQTLNQLLVEMDGFEANEGVILIAATNRPDVLDPALLRPGRFDRTVVVPLPDVRGREEILRVHVKKLPLADDVDVVTLAKGTPGFSGADLSNLANEAALHAALVDAEKVAMAHFEYAKDKILMGVERRSLALSDRDRRVSAFHEAGHALVARMLPNADPVHKVTIVPRGVALGLVQQLPEDEKHTYSKHYWLDRICVAFGGRAAEEIVFNEITTGASSDIASATGIARKMICEWGMSEKLGPLAYGRKDEAVFLGRELGHQRDYSETTAGMIDDEVRQIIETELDRSRQLISRNRKGLDALAALLLEVETLDAEQVDRVLREAGVEIVRRQPLGSDAVGRGGSDASRGPTTKEHGGQEREVNAA